MWLSLGEMELSIKYFSQLLTVAESIDDPSGQNHACKDLAALYNHFVRHTLRSTEEFIHEVLARINNGHTTDNIMFVRV